MVKMTLKEARLHTGFIKLFNTCLTDGTSRKCEPFKFEATRPGCRILRRYKNADGSLKDLYGILEGWMKNAAPAKSTDNDWVRRRHGRPTSIHRSAGSTEPPSLCRTGESCTAPLPGLCAPNNTPFACRSQFVSPATVWQKKSPFPFSVLLFFFC